MKKRVCYLLLVVTSLFCFNFITFSEASTSQSSTSKLSPTITPIKSVENIKLPIKSEQYDDFEELQNAKKIEVFAPSELPKGYLLQKIEYQNKTIKGTYLNGNQSLIFVQSPVPNDAMNQADAWKDNENEKILTWSSTNTSFEIKAINLNKEDLISFKQSLRSISNTTEDYTILPFQIITSTDLSEKNSPKNRTFSLFTPETFSEFVKKQRVVINKKWQAADDEVIIGLFAGEKASGYAVTASQITLQNNQLTVALHESKPDPNMSYPAVITYPFQFISIKIPAGKNVSSVQFISGKGEALANLILMKP
ncbi:hypothetical protein EHS13_03740 [Paenibacillus psychroresistens]|uniref:PrcB C-terminal domain-containing protein n=1 Tax=Paenibacillus psychroresistens TaxID=1778678 RepID=A0A6B8RCU7_9BACL|nr:protease complex subunit PrcB family protein [Paenibacillus psychroresistens]QGQ94079.1 hypothetical protein EHS13_03740 [Paenibacillus psychroresistens]